MSVSGTLSQISAQQNMIAQLKNEIIKNQDYIDKLSNSYYEFQSEEGQCVDFFQRQSSPIKGMLSISDGNLKCFQSLQNLLLNITESVSKVQVDIHDDLDAIEKERKNAAYQIDDCWLSISQRNSTIHLLNLQLARERRLEAEKIG